MLRRGRGWLMSKNSPNKAPYKPIAPEEFLTKNSKKYNTWLKNKPQEKYAKWFIEQPPNENLEQVIGDFIYGVKAIHTLPELDEISQKKVDNGPDRRHFIHRGSTEFYIVMPQDSNPRYYEITSRRKPRQGDAGVGHTHPTRLMTKTSCKMCTRCVSMFT
eukprot:2225174-Rhodomonas_salina.1